MTAATGSTTSRARRSALALLVAVPIVMNAVALAPEILYAAPNVNDDAEHLLMVRRANEALSTGEDPLDMWVPQLELGFPQFLYYQHLGHLTVVVLDRLLFGLLPIRMVFDLVRYILLVTFPLTVLWSMRYMGFPASTAAVAAASASLLSGGSYGFEYGSYTWSGFGLFTQLFGMHLVFVAMAFIERVISKGRGIVGAALACAALVLAHLIYAYMFAIATVVLLLSGLRPRTALDRVWRLAAVGAIALVISAYFVVPFFLQAGYLNVDPYLQRYKYDSFGAPTVLGWLVTGELFDHGRLPVLTALLAIGTVAAVLRREVLALRVAAVGALFLFLYFGRPTLGSLVDLLPMHEGLLLHRFIGGVDLAAIPLIGVGGGFLFEQLAMRVRRRGVAIATLAVLVLLTPALAERWRTYGDNTTWLRQTSAALAADVDAQAVLDRIANARPGRAYAGMRANWGVGMDFGLTFNSIRFYNLFADRGIDAVAPPFRGASLNADLLFDFNDQDLAAYQLFNVDYVVAPHGIVLPSALTVLLDTPRYVLYVAPGGGYAQYAGIARRETVTSQTALFDAERAFVLGRGYADDGFVRFDYLTAPASGQVPVPTCASGNIMSERVLAGRIDLVAQCDAASAMVLKVTFHPNWRVIVDGQQVATYMASPSLIGFDLAPGRHVISAEYRSTPLKPALFWLGLLAVVGLCARSVWPLRSHFADARARATDLVRRAPASR